MGAAKAKARASFKLFSYARSIGTVRISGGERAPHPSPLINVPSVAFHIVTNPLENQLPKDNRGR